MKRNPLDVLLGRMVAVGLIRRIAIGQYAHKDYTEPAQAAKHNSRAKSVASVRPVSDTGQIKDGGQSTDGTQESADLCPSVRSVREFTRTASADRAAPERVKTQKDQTDGKIAPQAVEKKPTPNTSDLSDPSDRTDRSGRDGGPEAAHDDLTIPPFLDRRNERPCDQCGWPGGEVWHYDGQKVWLHPHCEVAWIDARRSGATRAS